MSKLLSTPIAVAVVAGFAPAQSPAFAFRPTGTTGKLLTSESREHWAKVSAKLRTADKASDKVTDALGLPHVHAATAAAAAAKVVAPKLPEKLAEREPTVLLSPDRKRGGLTVGDGGR